MVAAPDVKQVIKFKTQEGWGLPEIAGDDPIDDRPIRLLPSPAEISRHLDALAWAARYLCPANAGSARMVGLWATCKASTRPFGQAVEDLRSLGRSQAYRLRDRGLSFISRGRDRDGGPVEPPKGGQSYRNLKRP